MTSEIKMIFSEKSDPALNPINLLTPEYLERLSNGLRRMGVPVRASQLLFSCSSCHGEGYSAVNRRVSRGMSNPICRVCWSIAASLGVSKSTSSVDIFERDRVWATN